MHMQGPNAAWLSANSAASACADAAVAGGEQKEVLAHSTASTPNHDLRGPIIYIYDIMLCKKLLL